jgi:argininosuccinate lyase
MKLWDKGKKINEKVDEFTAGKDRQLDSQLARADILGNLAHIRMLASINLLTKEECHLLTSTLIEIYSQIDDNFKIDDSIEDIHSQIEWMLTQKLGDVGKKIHSGRSRNDQILVDLKIFFREEIRDIVELSKELFDTFISLSEKHKDILMPGYTHLQIAMPSSFGLWFGAYAESLTDDMLLLQTAYQITNQNPLGSAAGYGTSFPINRTLTSQLLGFDDLSYNVIYAQMGRGKTEKIIAFALSSLGSTMAKMSMDVCLFMNQNFGFISFPDELTTGSSIMPHKKNPDVFELIRARGNRLQALPNDISLILTNLPSGYQRDLQILKELIFPAIDNAKSCLEMLKMMLEHIQINTNILDDPKYAYLFSVEEVNRLVLEGVPFRDAYKKVAKEIEEGKFVPDKTIKHTHEGSIGNLCNNEIRNKMDRIIENFHFSRVDKALEQLLSGNLD